jgi:phage protein D
MAGAFDILTEIDALTNFDLLSFDQGGAGQPFAGVVESSLFTLTGLPANPAAAVDGALSYPVRHPRWELTYAGQNITGRITSMATEISYSDHRAHQHHHQRAVATSAEADEVEVVLEDRDRRWQGPWFPVRGDIVNLLIGYEGEEQLLDCGDFQVDELELKGPPDTFHLKCIAAGITPSLRTPRSAAYETQTLLQVANTIAGLHQLTVTGIPQNINVSWQRITQRHETDLHFLRRLALAHNYDFSIRGTQLVFYARTPLEDAGTVLTITRGSAQSTQYQPRYAMPMPMVSGQGIFAKSFEFQVKTQKIYKSASVAYQNPVTKQLIAASSQDSSSPTGDDLHIVTRCENPQQAQLKADSALHDANMLQVTGRVETEGTVLLVAGVNVNLMGFGTFDGKYHIESSRHRLERSSGYTTEIEVRKLS